MRFSIGLALGVGWLRNMLYFGFNTLHRFVIRRQIGFAARITRTLSGLAMARTKTFLRSPRLRKPSLVMLILAAVYTIISFPFWLPFSFGEDFPNCVSARWDNECFAVGAMSQNRMSTLFITRTELDPSRKIWKERCDGHFCSFPIPTTKNFYEPELFNVVVSQNTIGWNCPYFLMMALWGAVYLANRKRSGKNQYTTIDILILVTLVGVVLGLIQLRMQLICIVIMNLLTFGLAAYMVFHGLKYMLVTSIPWLTPEPN